MQTKAVLKLATFGLDHGLDWDCGGYGFDSSLRWHLAGVVQRRAAAEYGTSFTEANTVLIGDTVIDVLAGFAVVPRSSRSPPTTRPRLCEAGATAVLPSLEDTDAVVAPVEAALSAGRPLRALCRARLIALVVLAACGPDGRASLGKGGGRQRVGARTATEHEC